MVDKKNTGRLLHVLAALLTLGGRISFAAGDVISVLLMGAGVAGAVINPQMLGALECLIAGLLGLAWRQLRAYKRWADAWQRQRLLVKLTLSSVGVNVCFYTALASTALGTVTGLMQAVITVLSSALVIRTLNGRRRLKAAISPLLAITGVCALTQLWDGAHLGIGLALSLAVGLFWFWNTRVSAELSFWDEATAHHTTHRAIALSGSIQLAIAFCRGVALHPAGNLWFILVIMLIGLLGTTIPNTIQVLVLGKRFSLNPATYTVLLNTGPAVAAIFGLLMLHQQLSLWQWLGLVAVSLAAVIETFMETHDPVHQAKVMARAKRAIAERAERDLTEAVRRLSQAVLDANKFQEASDKAEDEAAAKARLAAEAEEGAAGWLRLLRR